MYYVCTCLMLTIWYTPKHSVIQFSEMICNKDYCFKIFWFNRGSEVFCISSLPSAIVMHQDSFSSIPFPKNGIRPPPDMEPGHRVISRHWYRRGVLVTFPTGSKKWPGSMSAHNRCSNVSNFNSLPSEFETHAIFSANVRDWSERKRKICNSSIRERSIL
jgi:hypothetical protein